MDAAEPEAFPAQPSGGSSVGPDDAAAFFRQLGEQTSKVLTAAEEAGRGIREQARRDAAGIIAEARVEANELALAAASQRRAARGEPPPLPQPPAPPAHPTPHPHPRP